MSGSYKRINRSCGVDTLQINHPHNKFNFVLTSTRILFNIGVVSCVFMYKTIGKTNNKMYVASSRFNNLHENSKIELANIVEELIQHYIGEDVYCTSVVAENDRTFVNIPLEHEMLYSELCIKISQAIEKYNQKK